MERITEEFTHARAKVISLCLRYDARHHPSAATTPFMVRGVRPGSCGRQASAGQPVATAALYSMPVTKLPEARIARYETAFCGAKQRHKLEISGENHPTRLAGRDHRRARPQSTRGIDGFMLPKQILQNIAEMLNGHALAMNIVLNGGEPGVKIGYLGKGKHPACDESKSCRCCCRSKIPEKQA